MLVQQSMLDMYKAMEERNQGLRAEVPVANKLPLPLQIVVNAHSIDFHSKGLDSGGTLPPFPRPLMELNQFGEQQNRIQRYAFLTSLTPSPLWQIISFNRLSRLDTEGAARLQNLCLSPYVKLHPCCL